jgi:hypothetical protein
LSSRLGNPAPQPRTGAARFASPVEAKTPKLKSVPTLERQAVEESKREKQPMTIRLTFEAIDHLAELERSLRRVGIKARQASASEIVEAIIHATTPETIRKLIAQAE